MTTTPYTPPPIAPKVKPHYCPTCEKDTEYLGEHIPWHGWTITCLTCGDQWQDDYRLARPFRRGWRKDRVRRARERMEGYSIDK